MACGVNATQWRHFWGDLYRLQVAGAEIDPEVVALGREHFGMPGPEADWLEVHAADGRLALAAMPEDRTFHLLVNDAFANDLYIPFHLATREFFELCRRRLTPEGVLAMNVHAVGADAPNLRAVANTLATVFGRAVVVSRYDGANFLLLARNGGAPLRVGSFPDRPPVSEWDRLVELGAGFRQDWTEVTPRPGELVLTDDHAPLEWLTDRFLARQERESLAAEDAWSQRVRALARRQRIALVVVVCTWAAILLAAVLVFGRKPVQPSPGSRGAGW
jgi:hypothetical protein